MYFQLVWPFTILQNDNITVSWDFLRLKAPAAMLGHLGAVSWKKSHDIVILWFSIIESVRLIDVFAIDNCSLLKLAKYVNDEG